MSILCVKQEILTEQLCLWEEGELPSLPKPKSISDWFQWQVGIWAGGEITKDSSPMEIRTKINQIEHLMFAAVDEGVMEDTNPTYSLKHTFAPGVYGREMHIPAGHVVVGKLHKHSLLNILIKGKVTVITEQEGIKEYNAGDVFSSPIGTKRLLVTHEDTVWVGIHPTDETDLDKIEAEFIAKSYTELGWEQPKLLTEG